jgi:hypothetical protein
MGGNIYIYTSTNAVNGAMDVCVYCSWLLGHKQFVNIGRSNAATDKQRRGTWNSSTFTVRFVLLNTAETV